MLEKLSEKWEDGTLFVYLTCLYLLTFAAVFLAILVKQTL